MKKLWPRICFLLAALLLPLSAFTATSNGSEKNVHLQGETHVPVTVFPSDGKILLLWLPSENGLVEAEFKTAAVLAKTGIEVWLPDLHGAYFLPVVPSSMEKIPVADVARLIVEAQQQSRKAVYLVTEGRGAMLALQAAASLPKSSQPLRGAILLSPNLYVATPDPGMEAEYLPVASRTKLPIAWLQAENSPWRWRVEPLRSRLEKGGSKVDVVLLPDVRDRFYYREDASSAERTLGARLPQLIQTAQQTLEKKCK